MATAVPRKRKGETRVAYHDRLADLIRGAEEAGDSRLSAALQRKAGKLAHDHARVAEAHRERTKRGGPGTYPWYVCVEDQVAAGSSDARAKAICGRIRADSRRRYPEYWASREGYSSADARESEAKDRTKKKRKSGKKAAATNPIAVVPALAALGMHVASSAAFQGLAGSLAANPASDGVPFCGLGLDGGPNIDGPRDNVVVVDRSGKVLEMREIHGPQDLVRFDADYPGLPVFGTLRVLGSQLRDLRRMQAGPLVERRTR